MCCCCFCTPDISLFQMFSEPRSSLIPTSIPPVLSTPTSPISSASASPLSSASRSRTSTITSSSYIRTDASPSSQSNLVQNYSQQQHRQMKIGKYFLEKTIGKGTFAVVKLATHCDTHQKVKQMHRCSIISFYRSR
jgi:hypothetical protein